MVRGGESQKVIILVKGKIKCFKLCPFLWEQLGFGAYPNRVCRYRNQRTVELLKLEDQEFWTELTRLTQEGTLRLRWSWELMREMHCLVEVNNF